METNITEKTTNRVSFNSSKYTNQQLNEILKYERKAIIKTRRLRKLKKFPKVPDFLKSF